MLGLPYAFASHFAPAALLQALDDYRTSFKPSRQLDHPYAAAGVNVVIADTDAEAQRLFTSIQQQFTNLVRGRPGQLQPPIDDINTYWTSAEKEHVSAILKYSFVGSTESVRRQLNRFLRQTGVDEVVVASAMYGHPARLRSYKLLAEAYPNNYR
jgi:luciferase family oxidoreductase group 1